MAPRQSAAEQPAAAMPPSRHRSAAVTPKLRTAYHLLLQREQLLTSDLHSPPALIALRGTALVREAWTDIVEAGVGRRADLGQMTLFPRFSPPRGGPCRVQVQLLIFIRT